MSISEIFIRRPIATALMTAGLVAFGALSFKLLPVAALPNCLPDCSIAVCTARAADGFRLAI